MTKLLTKAQITQLLKNGAAPGTRGTKPVVKLFTPDGNATWLISEITTQDHNMAFGLCDIGQGTPELGYISLSELSKVRGRMGLPIERDQWFTANKSLAEYTEEAYKAGRIKA